MEIKVKVEIEGLEELVKAINNLGVKPIVKNVEKVDNNKIENKVEVKPVEAAKVEEPQVIEPVRPVITLDELKSIGVQLSKNGKTEEVKGILTEFGIKRFSDVTEDKKALLKEKLEALL